MKDPGDLPESFRDDGDSDCTFVLPGDNGFFLMRDIALSFDLLGEESSGQ
jgi:hypothetical protein